MKVKGRIKIYTKKKNGYVWKQAIINVRSEYIKDLEQFNGKEIDIFLGETKQKEAKKELKEVLDIVDKLFYNLVMAIPERKRRAIIQDNMELIQRLKKIKEEVDKE